MVYVKRGEALKPLSGRYSGPYHVLERTNKVFKLKIGDRVETVSRDRLKPHLGEEEPQEAAPPRRGRPPGTGGCG